MADIILYLDEGADPLAFRQLRRFLRKLGHRCRAVNAEQVIAGGWEPDTEVFAIGGGADVPYHNKLQGAGCARIREFVEQGGTYLGVCAGAYFGCASIDFFSEGTGRIAATRDLGLFPGQAFGPAYREPSYDPLTAAGARIALVHWFGEQTIPVFFNGGCAFRDAHLQDGVEVLGRYTELPGQPAAAVSCTVGKGRAVLCGTHPEYDTALLPDEGYFSGLRVTLDRFAEERVALFSRMLAAGV